MSGRSRAFAVVITSTNESMVGERIEVLRGSSLDVGAIDGDILLPEDGLAERHVTLEWRDDHVWLVPHAQMRVDEKNRREPHLVRGGERVDVGDATLVVLFGRPSDDLEAQYHETIYKMAMAQN